MPFRDISGHRHILGLLARAAAVDRVPPSLAFAGPRGVGKRLTAVALAQALNCLSPEATPDGRDACGRCATCRRIDRGVHTDVLAIEPEETGNIRIEVVRDAIDRAAYRPFEGRRRVVIIDEADALLVAAQNALLKILEEPPSASTFVLVTARPDVLLSTVRSRCPVIRFGRLAAADVARVLEARHGLARADAQAAAAMGEGSVGAALEGASDAFIQARAAAETFLRQAAAAGDAGRRFGASADLTKAVERLAKALGRGESSGRHALARVLEAASSLLRDGQVMAAGADERLLANVDRVADVRALLQGYDPPRLGRAYSAVDRAIAALDRNASPKIVADWLAFQV